MKNGKWKMNRAAKRHRNSTLSILHFTFAFAISAVAAERRTLNDNDYSYYRWTGAGETFAMRTAAATTNLAARQRFWKGVAADSLCCLDSGG